MVKNPLNKLHSFGQSIWLDFIRRDFLENGDMEALINEDDVKGVTSNPAIFKDAFASGDIYDAAIQAKASQGMNADEIYQSLAIEDIQMATDLFRPVFDDTNGVDGYVSLEVSPYLAHDTEGTIEEARELWNRVDRPNVMIKVPGTKEGLPAIEQLISEGININVTLLFGLKRYKKVTQAFINGLEKRAKAGKPVKNIASVASFFLSRIDVMVDPMLQDVIDEGGEHAELAQELFGEVAVSSAKKAYQIYKEMFEGARFESLAKQGAHPQRVLWASTSTKNDDFSDVKYVEALIGPDTVNTVPQDTLDAYRDHGKPKARVETELDKVDKVLDSLPKVGIDLDEVTQALEDEGVDKFEKPFDELMKTLKKKRSSALKLSVNTIKGQLPSAAKKRITQRFSAMDDAGFNRRLWQKDATLWKKDDDKARAMIPGAMGWLNVAETMAAAVPQMRHFVHSIKQAGFTHVVHMGMGGSSLAPLLFERTFKQPADGLNLTVLDTTDPATIKRVEKQVPLDKTLFIVASKSGSTAEPNAFGDYFYHKLKEKKGDKAGHHFAIITDPGSPLIQKAKKRGYRKVFENMPDIGGRYSALSYFGLVPAALMGIDVGDFVARALRMQHAVETTDEAAKNPGLHLGAALGELAATGRDKLTLVLPEQLSTLGMWLEQLIAESTGKEGKGMLPVTGEALLNPDEYGDDRQFVHLHVAGSKDKALHKKLDKLVDAGFPVITLELEELSDIAQEFYRWEVAVATAGAVLGINPFDQPNVQESKDVTDRLLKQASKGETVTPQNPDVKEKGIHLFANGNIKEGLAETLKSFFNQAGDDSYISIQAYLTEDEATEKALQELRTTLQKKYGVATTIGYGPRFLHSTGQYHKGGPNQGLFLQLTARDEQEVAVPGEAYTFSTFKNAQAAGDLQALQNHDRNTLHANVKAGQTAKAIQTLADCIK